MGRHRQDINAAFKRYFESLGRALFREQPPAVISEIDG
ncbi:MAG: hypothetical protein COB25_014395 [Oceanospirillales bacterium]|nr:hypothetical protein [Oceanospirillales bacterium]